MKTELDPIVSLTLLKSLLRPFAVAFTAALSLGIGEAKAEESTYSYEKSRLIVSGLAGSHVGGEGDLAIPLHLTNENVIAFNAIIYQYNTLYKTLEGGLFARQISPDGRHMYGANVYLGRQVSPNNHYSTRGTIGLEYGIDKVKFAINSYTFIGNKTTNLVDQGIQGGSVVGNNIVLDHQYAIEQIPTNGADISFSHQIDPKLKYLIGAFNFNNGIAGPKASVEYQVTAKTSVGLFAQYDDVRKGLAYVKLSYWLGAAESKPYVNSLLAPVAHDETSPARVVSPHTEKEIYEHNVYFVNAKGDLNASSGLNTPTAATTTVESISTLSKPGDFIIAAGNGSTLDLGNLTLQNAQTLQTRASNLIVNGVNVLPANTTQATTVSGTVTTQGAATINGINFINASTSTLNAITIAGADTVNLTNVNVSGYLGTGINVTGNSTVNLTTVTSNTNGVGLAASAGKVNILGSSNQFNSNTTGAGISITGTATLEQAQNIEANNNLSHGVYLAGASGTTTFTNVTANTNGGNGLWTNTSTVTPTGTLAFNNNIGSGILVDGTGSITQLPTVTTKNNGADGVTINGTSTYTSTWTDLTSTGNAGNGYSINNSNVSIAATGLVGDTNTKNGLAISAGSVSVTSTGNSFSTNTLGGVAVTDLGALTNLQNTAASNNKGGDGISIAGTTTYTSTWTGLTSTGNTGNGYSINNATATITADTLTGSTNSQAGLLLTAGTVTVNSGSGNTFNSNTGAGMSVGENGVLAALTNATLDSNKSDGLNLAGAGNIALTSVTSTNNTGNGIKVNNTAANVTITNITSSTNTAGSGMWINTGTVQDGGSTANVFSNNSQWGILVGNNNGTTATAGRLLSLNNTKTNSNGADGIMLNSSSTTDTVNFDSITSSSNKTTSGIASTGNGIVIKQAGTFNFTTLMTTSSNADSGLRINNASSTVTINNITSNTNTNYGLRVQKANAVTVQGTANNFSSNGYMGAYIGVSSGSIASTVNLTNVTANSNITQHGISVWNNTGTATLTNVTSASNGIDGLNIVSSTVNASGVTINNNARDGIFASNTAAVTLSTPSSIYDNNQGGGTAFAIEAQSGATVTVTDPSKLLGKIANTNNAATVTVNYKGSAYTPLLDSPLTCTIENNAGSCHSA